MRKIDLKESIHPPIPLPEQEVLGFGWHFVPAKPQVFSFSPPQGTGVGLKIANRWLENSSGMGAISED